MNSTTTTGGSSSGNRRRRRRHRKPGETSGRSGDLAKATDGTTRKRHPGTSGRSGDLAKPNDGTKRKRHHRSDQHGRERSGESHHRHHKRRRHGPKKEDKDEAKEACKDDGKKGPMVTGDVSVLSEREDSDGASSVNYGDND